MTGVGYTRCPRTVSWASLPPGGCGQTGQGRELLRDRRQAVDFNLAEYSDKGRGLIELSAEMQGNRNPMIDRPEWASAIDFTAEWASPRSRTDVARAVLRGGTCSAN
jgi:hypothetical protein